MRIISNLKKLAVLCFVTTAIISCNNDDYVAPLPVDNSIAGIASRDAQFTVLVDALSRAGLVNTLKGTGPFTVFAPTNTAFNAFLTANGFANLDAVPVPLLKEILLNHVVSGAVQSTALTTGYIKTLAKGSASSTNTLSMYVNTANNGVRLNGVSGVTTPNILATNGVIHVVNAVIGLPTIVTHTVANPNFEKLKLLVTSPAQSAVLAALSGSGPLTVFAPLNAAVDAATGSGGFASGASDAAVTRVLQYHVVAGNNLAASLVDNTDITSVANQPGSTTVFQTLKVFTSAPLGPRLQDKATAPNNISKIVATDVQCSNGVIHAVDKVLQPNL